MTKRGFVPGLPDDPARGERAPVICAICLKSSRSTLEAECGAVCPDCLLAFREGGWRENDLHRELLEEDPLSMPDFLKVRDFERLMLKVALHALRSLGPEHLRHMRHMTPPLAIPSVMALHLKGKVLDRIPLFYVSSMDCYGKSYGKTYQFKKDVPREVVVDAMTKAGLLGDEEDMA